jgi:hypothetical protein
MFIFSFFLPFVAVQECSTKNIVSYPGTELIDGFRGPIYLIPMALFFGYFILSFFKQRVSNGLRSFLQSWKALTAVLSGVVVVCLPSIDYLFRKVYPREGQILALIACLLVYLDGMTESAISLGRFKREPQKSSQGLRLSRVMYIIHFSILLISCVLIFFYFIKSNGHVFALFMVLFLSIPFLFSESITLYAVKRNEKWTYGWSIILMIGASILIFIYISKISDYVIH